MARVTVVDSATFADVAAERIARLIEEAIARSARATVSLTGGSTPEQTYVALADPARPYRDRIDWSRVHVYWGDERHVPPDHPDSNFGMANRTLLQRVPIPAHHVHRMQAELADAHDTAATYARDLPATFDLMLLGMGEDCHIASIFPGSELLGTRATAGNTETPGAGDARVAAVFAPHLNAWRITLTPPVLTESAAILMLVSGRKKAAAVADAIEAPLDVVRYPGQLLRQAGERVEWLLDPEAASALR